MRSPAGWRSGRRRRRSGASSSSAAATSPGSRAGSTSGSVTSAPQGSASGGPTAWWVRGRRWMSTRSGSWSAVRRRCARGRPARVRREERIGTAMTSTTPRLAPVELPSFGRSATRPVLPDASYAGRLARLRARASDAGYSHIIVYADREHSANLSFLTGFDPRFEEAVLIVRVASDDDPAILVGNECWGLAGSAPLPMRRHRYQELSLPSQPRDRSESFPAILAAEGIGARSRVGVVGWKPLWRPELLDVPSYLADDLRSCVAGGGSVTNATSLLIDPADGLRIVNEVEQLA